MNSESHTMATNVRHASPPLGIVATIFVTLKMASLVPVSAFGMALGIKPPFFPGPTAPDNYVDLYFGTHSFPVLICAFLQFGAAVPLGIFTASVVSRLRLLGLGAAGVYIALFGGFMAAFDQAASAAILWAMAHPSIAQAAPVVRALHALSFAFGGPGFTVPLGLLLAGVSVAAGLAKLLPRWIVALGLVPAVTGELSWLNMIILKLIVLIPLTRFLGFVWLIAAGFALPKAVTRPSPGADRMPLGMV
jgi:hypothetical protein